jgi:hypothetical protein
MAEKGGITELKKLDGIDMNIVQTLPVINTENLNNIKEVEQCIRVQ